jgi:ABC-2 type transport system ATP-binding protein
MAVELNHVSIRYGKLAAVDRLSLTIAPGEIFGLLGPNGSGKSSTLAAVAGLLEPAEGVIRVAGCCRRDFPLLYARRIGYVAQEPALYDELSAVDNLDYFASLYDLGRRERRRRIGLVLEQVGLSARAHDRVGALSGGLRRRLHVAAALIHGPAVLLLDEPSVALDPASRELLFRLLADLREGGLAIVVTTHQVDEAEQWCDRVGILRQGRLIAVGRPADALHPRRRRATIFGTLRNEMDERTETALRQRLGEDSSLRVAGRQFTLHAPDNERLALALALLASAGTALESFRTLPGRIEATPSTISAGPAWAVVEEAACSVS